MGLSPAVEVTRVLTAASFRFLLIELLLVDAPHISWFRTLLPRVGCGAYLHGSCSVLEGYAARSLFRLYAPFLRLVRETRVSPGVVLILSVASVYASRAQT